MNKDIHVQKLWATIVIWICFATVLIVFLNKVSIHQKDALTMGMTFVIVLSLFACVTSLVIWSSRDDSP